MNSYVKGRDKNRFLLYLTIILFIILIISKSSNFKNKTTIKMKLRSGYNGELYLENIKIKDIKKNKIYFFDLKEGQYKFELKTANGKLSKIIKLSKNNCLLNLK